MYVYIYIYIYIYILGGCMLDIKGTILCKYIWITIGNISEKFIYFINLYLLFFSQFLFSLFFR